MTSRHSESSLLLRTYLWCQKSFEKIRPYRFVACNALLIVLSVLHWYSIVPKYGVWGAVDLVLMLVCFLLMAVLFAEMFKAMVQSDVHLGVKIQWGVLFVLTFYIGAFAYYVAVIRRAQARPVGPANS